MSFKEVHFLTLVVLNDVWIIVFCVLWEIVLYKLDMNCFCIIKCNFKWIQHLMTFWDSNDTFFAKIQKITVNLNFTKPLKHQNFTCLDLWWKHPLMSRTYCIKQHVKYFWDKSHALLCIKNLHFRTLASRAVNFILCNY